MIFSLVGNSAEGVKAATANNNSGASLGAGWYVFEAGLDTYNLSGGFKKAITSYGANKSTEGTNPTFNKWQFTSTSKDTGERRFKLEKCLDNGKFDYITQSEVPLTNKYYKNNTGVLNYLTRITSVTVSDKRWSAKLYDTSQDVYLWYWANKDLKSTNKAGNRSYTKIADNLSKTVAEDSNDTKNKVYRHSTPKSKKVSGRDDKLVARCNQIGITPPSTMSSESGDTCTVTVKFKSWKQYQVTGDETVCSWNAAKDCYDYDGEWVTHTKTFKVYLVPNYTKAFGNKPQEPTGGIIYTRGETSVKDPKTLLQYEYFTNVHLSNYNEDNPNYNGSTNAMHVSDIQNCVNNKFNGVKFGSLTYTDTDGYSNTYSSISDLSKSFGQTFSKDGNYELNLIDNSKTESNGTSITCTWTTDATPPKMNLSGGTDYSYGNILYSQSGVDLSFDDTSGVENLVVEKNGGLLSQTVSNNWSAIAGSPFKSGNTTLSSSGLYRYTATDKSGNKLKGYAYIDDKAPDVTLAKEYTLSYRYTGTGNFVDGDGNILLARADVPKEETSDGKGLKIDVGKATAIILNDKANLGVKEGSKTSIQFQTEVWDAARKKVGTSSNAKWRYSVNDTGGIVATDNKVICKKSEIPREKDKQENYIKDRVIGYYNGMLNANKGTSIAIGDNPDGKTAFIDNNTVYYNTCNASGIAKVEIEGDEGTAVYEAPANPYIDDDRKEGNISSKDTATTYHGYTVDPQAYIEAMQSFKENAEGWLELLGNNFDDKGRLTAFNVQICKSGQYTVTVTDKCGNTTEEEFYVTTDIPSIEGVDDLGIYNSEVTVDFVYEDTDNFDYALLSKYTDLWKIGSQYTIDNATKESQEYTQLSYTYRQVEGNNGWHNIMLFSNNTAAVPMVDFQLDFNEPRFVTNAKNNTDLTKFFAEPSISYGHKMYSGDSTITEETGGSTDSNGMEIKDGSMFGLSDLKYTSESGEKCMQVALLEDNPMELYVDGVYYTPGEIDPTVDSIERAKFEANKINGDTLTIVDQRGTSMFRDNYKYLKKTYRPNIVSIDKEGEHTLEALDYAGNVSAINFTIDKTSPEITINDETGNDKITVTDSATIDISDNYDLKADSTMVYVMDKNGNWKSLKDSKGNNNYDEVTISQYGGFINFMSSKPYYDSVKVDTSNDYKVQHYKVETTDKAGNKSTREFDIQHVFKADEYYSGLPTTVLEDEGEYKLSISGGNRPSKSLNITILEKDVDSSGAYKDNEYKFIDDIQGSGGSFKGLVLYLYPDQSVSTERVENTTENTAVDSISGYYSKTVSFRPSTTTYVSYQATENSSKVTKKTVKAGAVYKASKSGFYSILYDSDDDNQEGYFTVDKQKPVFSVKNKKTVKKGKKVTVYDKLTGVKQIKLNGKKLKSKKVKTWGKTTIKLTKTGKNKIQAVDKTGNKKTITVKVKSKSSKKKLSKKKSSK